MRTDLYLHRSKDENHEEGTAIGLQGDALDMFLYACAEVKLTVDVDMATGLANIVAVNNMPLDLGAKE